MIIFYSVILALCGLAMLFLLRVGYWYYCQDRFVEVIRGRLYRCKAMPGPRLLKTVRKYGIRNVIDLRRPANSGKAIEAERRCLEEEGVGYFNIPANQSPSAETVDAFLEAVEQADPGPLLVHCRDGRGRAVFYSAIYLIEYQGLTQGEARRKCRLVASRGTFSPTGAKGRFLLDYSPRQNAST
jgi:protein tyrosine phosphatase (PTP) superfamily phosphohydrolase (DUF442 family)